MGKFAISLKVKILAWACAALIVGLNAKLVVRSDWLTGLNNIPAAAIWIYTLVIPSNYCHCAIAGLCIFKTLLFKHHDKPAQVPHGLATMITDLTPISYKNIGITIDFSKNDKDCIRHAIMQGGKHAQYTLIHVVETAGARYYGTEVLDHETQSDADNLDKYVQSLKEHGL